MRRGETGPASVAERMLSLLEAIAAQGEPVTLAELTETLGLAKATTHRLANQLVDLRYLERTPDAKRYAVGPRLAGLATGALRGAVSWGPRRAILRELVETLNETCNITVLDGGELVYLDRVESAWPLQVRLHVGSRVPLHCTASGKLFLAFGPEKVVQGLFRAGGLKRHTPRTLVEPDALLKALKDVRTRGFGTDNEEFIEGMTAVAVPVLDRSKRIVATIAVHGPVTRLPLPLAIDHIPALRDAAARLGEIIGGEAG
jgi:IclR family acetate operon transcriptional repressor